MENFMAVELSAYSDLIKPLSAQAERGNCIVTIRFVKYFFYFNNITFFSLHRVSRTLNFISTF